MAGALDGKISIVTGGASGIGAATARVFAERGARVIVADVQDGRRIANEVGGEFVATDVRRDAAVRELIEGVVARHGRVDVIFNNAGIEIHAPIAATDDAAHCNLIEINVNGVFRVLKYGLQVLMKNAAPRRGVIINTASVAGLIGAPMLGSYDASKHAVVGLTKTAAAEYGAFGIRVCAVCPGIIRTPMMESLAPDPAMVARLGRLHPLGRVGEPEEVARVVAFLASDDASFVSGVALPVDGAMTAVAGAGGGGDEPLIAQ